MRVLSSQHLHGFWRFPREPRVYIKGKHFLSHKSDNCSRWPIVIFQHYHEKDDQHYHEKDESASISWEPRIGCSWEPGHELWMCWVEGCNPDNHNHYCFRHVFCDGDLGYCERHKDCLIDLPCYGPCWWG